MKLRNVLKNIIKSLINRYNYIINSITLNTHHIIRGQNLHINGMLIIRGTGLSFGNDVRINSGKRFNIIGGDRQSTFIMRKGAFIIIGNNVGISNSTFVAHEKIIIEDNVMIGGGCKIYDTDFHSLNFEERMEEPDTNIRKSPVHIKTGAFIGAHSIILKGVVIGKKSVIGAGSVVTKNIPDNQIWAGNPAKFIKNL
ncbi:acyltransferase [Clostridium sp. YIM B02506]|uniref:acyltransferase n=1 Tax=Clostridium sp. YIM B02506 TaxID=2910680 RepID=UPI001EECF487|nr:acyltransferase [Clostridium sp. YIM B02506]